MQLYDEKTLSCFALDTLQKMETKPLYAEEIKTWDGIDEFGPQIFIYDLYVILDKSPSIEAPLYEYRYYHIEHYECEDTDQFEYYLEKTEYHNKIASELFTL